MELSPKQWIDLLDGLADAEDAINQIVKETKPERNTDRYKLHDFRTRIMSQLRFSLEDFNNWVK